MTRARALLGAAVLFLASATEIVTAAPAHACTCIGFTDDQAFARADVVFTGRAVARTTSILPARSPASTLWTFTVDAVYKGTAARRQGVVTMGDGPACGLDVPRDQAVVVFARRRPHTLEADLDGATLWANQCEGTRTTADRPVPTSFGRTRAPAAGEGGIADVGTTTSDLTRWAIASAVGLGVVATALVPFLRRRRRTRRAPAST
jgi:hypothetical protein